MVKANKNAARCWNTKAADKKRELSKTCFCIIVHLFREFVKGAALLLGFLAVASLCEALAGSAICWLIFALCAVGCNWCCGLLLPATEMAQLEVRHDG